MDCLDYPSRELWEERRQWIEDLAEPKGDWGGYLVSEQACAITADIQSAFCAGAWIAVIVLVMAAVDAHLRETEAPGFRGNLKQLLEAANSDARLQNLRKRRNALVHVQPETPAITVDQQWSDRMALEAEAREAVRLMFNTFYANPSI